MEVAGDRARLVLQASHLPYHQACHREVHLGYCLAYREGSLQVHHQEHSRLEGHRVHLAEPFGRLSLQRRIPQEGWRVGGGIREWVD